MCSRKCYGVDTVLLCGRKGMMCAGGVTVWVPLLGEGLEGSSEREHYWTRLGESC